MEWIWRYPDQGRIGGINGIRRWRIALVEEWIDNGDYMGSYMNKQGGGNKNIFLLKTEFFLSDFEREVVTHENAFWWALCLSHINYYNIRIKNDEKLDLPCVETWFGIFNTKGIISNM